MYILNTSKMFGDISDGFAVVINAQTGIYYGMNQLGTAVFEQISNGVATDKVLDALKGLDGAPADVDARLQKFIDELLAKEIIIKGDTNGGDFTISADVAKSDNFVLDLSEYADAQELLLADPIHDVEEELGWQPILKDGKKA
ncbi:hypothetical protein RsTz2092_06940 [Deferribacterales bacterium RsTz2092]|nr:hypothetical protein AGMMS49941_05090 [Deferribacterales bacterium]